MMPRFCHLIPCCLVALLTGLSSVVLEEACAQAVDPGSDSHPGPSRASLNTSAASLAVDPPPSPVWILGRFDAFQTDFSADFGFAGSSALDPNGGMEDLQSRIATRWGDERWFQWVRRGLALYARIQSMTETEQKGFDMQVEMDDLPQGKVGVRVNRALE